MDASILSVVSGTALAGGVWALMKLKWHSNGSSPKADPVPVPGEIAQAMKEMRVAVEHLRSGIEKGHPEPVSAAWQEELLRSLRELPGQLAPSVDLSRPAWPADLVEPLERLPKDLERITAQLQEMLQAQAAFAAPVKPPPEPRWPAEMTRSWAGLEQRLERLIQQLSAPAAPRKEFAELSEQLSGISHELGRVVPALGMAGWSPAGGGSGGYGNGGTTEPHPGPYASNPAGFITLDTFNTLVLDANTVCTLVPPESGIHSVSIMNLGPGHVYLRANADPAVNDLHSLTLLAGSASIDIHIPDNLRVLGDQAGTMLTAQLGYQ